MYKGESITFLEVRDFLLVPIYLFFIILFALLIRNITLQNSPLRKYFIPGMMAKIIGGLAVGAVYGFYYGGGDTFYYYYDSRTFNDAIRNGGVTALFNLLFLPAKEITIATYENTRWLTYFRDPSGWMADKVYGVVSIFSFHSYPVMSIVISVLSFTGVWAMYRAFCDQYPQLYKQLALCVLFIPSVFFWGSGILKDSITFGCVSWITAASYQIFFKRRKIFRNILIILFTGYIALEVKAYIVISFFPSLLFWIFLTYRSKIENQFLRVVIGPVVFIISLVFGYMLVKRIGDEFSQFSLANVRNTAETFHEWHSYLAENANASGYSLGNVTGTWQNVLSKFPLAVNVTLFRPYLWEAHSVIMLLSAVESTIIMGFTVYIIWKNGFRKTFSTIFRNPTIFFCFFFSMIFAFSVGFTSYNFGALVRYKIPCIPFYLCGLVILYNLILEERKARVQEDLLRKSALGSRRGIEETV